MKLDVKQYEERMKKTIGVYEEELSTIRVGRANAKKILAAMFEDATIVPEEYAKANGIHYMIRGLRNNMDYNYEENIAEINKLINPNLEYVYFRAENVAVSSSMVKELNSYNLPGVKFLQKYS